MTSSYKVLNIPESASLALHAARAIVRAGEPLTAAEIAEVAGVSRHHLSKVLRKMVEAGIVSVSHGRGKDCLFGSLLGDVNKLYLSYFSKTKISNLQQRITD